MQLRKFMVPVVAVALSVTACGGDDSSSGDETADNGDAAGDESSAEDAEDAGEAGDTEGSDDESTEDDSQAGGDGDGADGAALFEAIANAYIDAGSFEFESTTTEAGQEMTLTGAMEVDSDGSFTNMRMSMNQGGVESTVLMVDGQMYMEMTGDMAMPGVDASWLSFGGTGAEGVGEDMAGAFDDVASAGDLSARLEENAELLTVTEVGEATVDGVATTEYDVVVNDVAAYLDAEGDLGITEMSYTMWIDGDNYIRRMVQQTNQGTPVEMIYKNYGVDVDISAPPEDEVVDFAEMMNQ